jgi:lysophospholipase L1-like esterase
LLLALGLTGCSYIPKANANIAFMGDSITFLWWLPTTNFGISGNTTSQMLVRFPNEVLGQGYKAVVILGGTNDVRMNKTPIETFVPIAIANIETMAEEAQKDDMDVVLCLIPPIENENSRVEPLNEAIEALAQQHQYKLVNYYTPMVGHPDYFHDGIHPTDEGYFVMQAALTKVISLNY